jgi:hypothetical protein
LQGLKNRVLYSATGWTIGVLGFDSQPPLGIFLFTTVSRTALGTTQPPIQWVLLGAVSLGVKLPGREADNSPSSSAEVTNAWSYTSTPQYVFIAWCFVKHSDNFTFTFYTIGSLPRRIPTRALHQAFQIPYVYDYIKICRKQAEVIQTHDNVNVRNISIKEAQHRKYKRPKLGGGQAYDRLVA